MVGPTAGGGTVSALMASPVAAALSVDTGPAARAVPPRPFALVATALSTTDASLTWLPAEGEPTAIRVERSVADGPFAPVATLPGTAVAYADAGLTPGQRYGYRLVSVNAGGDSIPTDPAFVDTSGLPRLRVGDDTLYLTDAVGGRPGVAGELTLTNIGLGDLVVPPTGFAFSGPDAAQFTADVGSYPLLLGPGRSATLRVRMAATRTGVADAVLRISSNDGTSPVAEVVLRGIGTAAGSRGPTPQQALDLRGIPVSVARPITGAAGTVKGERTIGLLTKAGPGPVVVEAVGTTAAGITSAEVVSFGRYAPAPTPVRTPLFAIGAIDAASVSPAAYGKFEFDPAGEPFGLYADWPGVAGKLSFTQDGLNAFEPSAAGRRKIRFYQLRDAAGAVVPDAYVVTADLTGVATPRTVTLIVRNVRHASLPAGWQSHDVGSAGVAGYATAANGAYTVGGGGADIGGSADAFHYAYRTLRGDGEIVARVKTVENTNAAARAGVMVRASLEPNAANAVMGLTAGGTASFRWRSGTGGAAATSAAAAGYAAPGWVRLVRAGNTVTGYRSKDGVAWTKQGSATVALGADVFVGLAVTAKDNAKLSTSTFDGVRVTPALAANRPPVPPQVVAPDSPVRGPAAVRAYGGDAATSARLVVDGAYVGPAVAGAGPYAFTWNSVAAADGPHAVGVETTDRFGGRATTTVAVTTSNPDLPPLVRLLGVGQGARVAGAIDLSAEAVDERRVVDVTYLLDGVPIGPALTAAPYARSWNPAGATGGWHALSAVARDAGGNVATPAEVKIYVAAAAPTAAVTTPFRLTARRYEDWPWVSYDGQVLPGGVRAPGAAIPRSEYGGDTSRRLAATGFFRTEKVDGRWWLVDPQGYLYFDNSAVAVAPKVFDNNRATFEKKFGTGDAGKLAWARWARAWLRDVGIYTAAWTDPSLLRRAGAPMNYELVLDLMSGFGRSIGSVLPGTGHSNYANDAIPVFDPRFAAYCDNYFANVFPTKFPGLDPRADPYLVGYMTDNELPWGSSTLDNYLTLPAGDANRAAAEAWLAARGVSAPGEDDRRAFLSYVADTYFRVTSRAVRAYDPNHLLLGARFLGGDGRKPYLFQAAKPYVDVASVNFYDDLDPAARLGAGPAAADLPFMVTEAYAKGQDSGLANRAGYGLTVRTQADRGAYYQSLSLSLLGSANAVGLSWLSLVDNNASNAAADPSNTDANKGLMPITYPDHAANPYKALTDRVRDVNANLYAILRNDPVPPPPPPLPPAATPTTFAATAAAYVRDGTYAGQNFGADPTVVVKQHGTTGYRRNGLLRFDLSPATATVNSATLRLYGKLGTAGAGVTVNVYGSTNTAWGESAVTWAAQPTTAGSPLKAFVVSGTAARWYEVDLTAHLAAERAAGRSLVTLVLKSALAHEPNVLFNSDEAATGVPEVVVA